MSNFKDSLRVNNDLLDPKICKDENFWGCIEESLGIDHRIIANRDTRDTISSLLREMTKLHLSEFVKNAKEQGKTINDNHTDKQIQDAFLEWRLGKADPEGYIRKYPRLTHMVLKSVGPLKDEESKDKSIEYGLNIDQNTGNVEIKIKTSKIVIKNKRPVKIKIEKTLDFTVDEKGNIVKKQTKKKEGLDNGAQEETAEITFDSYGATQKVSFKRTKNSVVQQEFLLERLEKYPFVVKSTEFSIDNEERKIKEEKFIALNKDNLNDLDDFQYVIGEGDAMEFVDLNGEPKTKKAGPKKYTREFRKFASSSNYTGKIEEVRCVTFKNEDEMKKYFEEYGSQFGGIKDGKIKRLFQKAGLIEEQAQVHELT